MARIQSLYQLETLFIDKLSEKYNLNIRDLKKAFSKFDKDANGLLDLTELESAINVFLNGINKDQIKSLVQCYDINGDGKISFEEFLYFISTRSAVKKKESNKSDKQNQLTIKETIDEIKSLNSVDNSNSFDLKNYDQIEKMSNCDLYSEKAPSDILSELDLSNPEEIEYRAKIFLQNLKAILVKKSFELRAQGKIPNQITMTSSELAKKVSTSLLSKAFQQYTGMEDGRTRGLQKGVEFGDFCRVLRSLGKSPGSSNARTEVLQFLFSLCVIETAAAPIQPKTTSVFKFGPKDNNLAVSQPVFTADPLALIPLIFPTDSRSLTQDRFSGPAPPPVLAGQGLKRDASGRSDPFPVGGTGLAQPPARFLSRKCRTTFLSPASMTPALLARSGQRPAVAIDIEFIYSINTSLHSGSNILALPGDGSGPILLYASAAVAVLHDLSTHSQRYFRGHTDDITCLSLSPCGQWAATGCVSSPSTPPVARVWPTAATSSSAITAAGRAIGQGFFRSAVTALCFSGDSSLLCGISGEERHRMGIWLLSSGELLAETSAAAGVPPQVRCLLWAPSEQTLPCSAPCQLLCTAGERHLRLWSLRRDAKAGEQGPTSSTISFKACTVESKNPKEPRSHPKAFLCAVFVPLAANSRCSDLLAGGSDGWVHRWSGGQYAAGVHVVPGGAASCLALQGPRLIVGGGSLVKVLDRVSLETLFEAAVCPPAVVTSRPRSSSATPAARLGRSVQQQQQKQQQQSPGAVAEVLGLALLVPPGRAMTGQAMTTRVHIFVSTTSGRLLRFELALPSFAGSKAMQGKKEFQLVKKQILFYFCTGSLHALSCEWGGGGHLVASGSSDRRLSVWDTIERRLLARTPAQSATVQCCHFDRTSSHVAIGLLDGFVSIFALETIAVRPSTSSSTASAADEDCGATLRQLASRRDCLNKEACCDIKFSPDSSRIAMAGADNFIYIYCLSFSSSSKPPGCALRYLHRLAGHSSFVSHIGE